MHRRGLGRFSGSRAEPPAREPDLVQRISPGQPANDNAAPLASRLLEAAKWLLLLALIFGLGTWFYR